MKQSFLTQFDVIKLGHIDAKQLSSIMGFMLWTKVFLMLPSLIIAKTGSGAWLTLSLSSLFALAGMWGWVKWSESTKDLGIVPSLRLTLGRVIGDLVALFMALYFLIVTSLSIRVFAGGAVIGLLPGFPIETLLVVIIGSSIYATFLGLETVGRSAVVFFPVIIVSMVLIVVGSYKLFDFRHLQPVFGLGLPVLIKESIPHTGLFGAISVVGILKSYVRDPAELPKSAYMGLAIAAVLIISSVVLVSAIFPYPISTSQIIPLSTVARAVFLGRFLQRIEAVFTFTWFFASVIHASTSYMMTLILFSQLMNVRTFRPLIPSITSLTFGLGALPESIIFASRILSNTYLTFGTVSVVMGLVFYAVAKIRKTAVRAEAIHSKLIAEKEKPGYPEELGVFPSSQRGDKKSDS